MKNKKLQQAALKRLHRKKPSGNFEKIAEKAAKEYGSKEAGQRVAAAVYWKKVRKLNESINNKLKNRRYGKPKTDIERLKTHFGKDWKKHKISELPPRGARNR